MFGIIGRSPAHGTTLRVLTPGKQVLTQSISGRQANVFYNTGHGHLGWTLSAVTAEMVGDVIRQAAGERATVRAGLALAGEG